MKVMIDPGHGGKFSGMVAFTPRAVANGQIKLEPETFSPLQWIQAPRELNPGVTPKLIKEKNINLFFARLLTAELMELGVEVRMTRMMDGHLREKLREDLAARAAESDLWDADCFISIHCNGFDISTANGFEVFTTPGVTWADGLATKIIHEMQFALPTMWLRVDMSDGDPDKEAEFAVLRRTHAPAVLIELGFLTNEEDVIKLLSPGVPRKVAHHIAKAIFEWRKERLNK